MTWRARLTACLIVACLSTAAFADERLLLPVYVQTRGAFGSLFVSELTAFNDTDQTQLVRGLVIPCITSPCPPDTSGISIPPHHTFTGFFPTGEPGHLVTIADGARVEFNLRVRDLSRREDSAGTEVPVVRESDFLSRVNLLNVPAEANFRRLLRLYSGVPIDARITIRSQGDDSVLSTATVHLAGGGLETPAYAEFRDFPASISPLRIEIEPIDPAGKLWAFVSVTNNSTQEITLVTPQGGPGR